MISWEIPVWIVIIDASGAKLHQQRASNVI
jgi:hypothetical protein